MWKCLHTTLKCCMYTTSNSFSYKYLNGQNKKHKLTFITFFKIVNEKKNLKLIYSNINFQKISSESDWITFKKLNILFRIINIDWIKLFRKTIKLIKTQYRQNSFRTNLTRIPENRKTREIPVKTFLLCTRFYRKFYYDLIIITIIR